MKDKQTEALKLALDMLKQNDEFLYLFHECESEEEIDQYTLIRKRNENAITFAEKALAEQPAQQHDYRIKYDRPCYKCRSNFCPGSCKEPEHLKKPAQQTWNPKDHYNDGWRDAMRSVEKASSQQQEPDVHATSGKTADELWLETGRLRSELADLNAQQQEPVAYMGTDIEGNPNKFRLNPFGGCVPLYEKPQSVKVWDAEGYDALCQELEGWKAKASKPWVGLTAQEWLDVGCKSDEDVRVGLVIQAKLKDKNGY